MQLKVYKWIVLLAILEHITSATRAQRQADTDYFYQDPEIDGVYTPNNEMEQQAEKYLYSGIPYSDVPLADPAPDSPPAGSAPPAPADAPAEPATAAPAAPAAPAAAGGPSAPAAPGGPEAPAAPGGPGAATAPGGPGASTAPGGPGAADASGAPGAPPAPAAAGGAACATAPPPSAAPGCDPDQEAKAKELRNLIQHLYVAQARVQLEATEIKKAQAVANVAQQQLEEAANHVRSVTAALQNAQQEVAAAAIRAQTATLQLAAHDQLLFAARQDVDALSSQMVGLQAAEGISQPKITFDLMALLEKLRQPLTEDQKPTAVTPIVTPPPFNTGPCQKVSRSRINRNEIYK